MLLVVTAAPARARNASDPGEIVLDRADPTVAAIVAGVPMTFGVLPDTGINLSDGAAARVPVAWRQAQRLDIGRVAVPVREAMAEVRIADVPVGMRLTTSPVPCCRGHDGSIGAIDLPWRVVRIGRAGALPERRFPAETASRDGLSIPWKVGRETIRLVLAPDNPETVATASAAAILSKAYGGHLQAMVRDVPILFGIARPVRDMTFDSPVSIAGFALSTIAVRVADFAGAAGVLRDSDDAAQAPLPADGIVVSHRAPPPQYRWAAVTLGRDLLGRCPMIAVYVQADEIGLACNDARPTMHPSGRRPLSG